ncbi:MAG: hypothetical protein H7X71_04210 [Chitinophagales bacterium]|nr:hypothetical protein [Chitinophagales bacterium]
MTLKHKDLPGNKFWIISSLLLFFIVSCKKDEIIHENVLLEGNTPPPATGISDIQLNTYVNNLYIDMFGRAPTEDELSDAKVVLKENLYSADAREQIISGMMESYEYYKNISVLTSQKMLVDIDSLTVQYEIDLYVYLIEIAELTGDSVGAFYLNYYLTKLLNLKNAPVDLYEGTITINEYIRRYIDNTFYDEVNMGSENFVVSCFENLFHRQPTDDEKYYSILMVDESSSEVLLQTGSTKDDFINIVTSALEFYQGQVLEAFTTLLARNPSSYEMNMYALQMMETGSFNTMKTELFKSEEYAGF